MWHSSQKQFLFVFTEKLHFWSYSQKLRFPPGGTCPYRWCGEDTHLHHADFQDGIQQGSVLGPLWFSLSIFFLHLKSPLLFSLRVLLNIFVRHGEQDRATSPRQDLFIFWTNTLNHTIWSLIKPFLMIHFFTQRSLRCLSSLLSSQDLHSEGLPHGHHQITISMSTFSNIYHWFPVVDRFTLNTLMLAYDGRSRSTPASGNFWNSVSSYKPLV